MPQTLQRESPALIEIGAGLLADQQFVGLGCWKRSRDELLVGATSLVDVGGSAKKARKAQPALDATVGHLARVIAG